MKDSCSTALQSRQLRGRNGFSLAATLAVGTVSMLWVGAMAATVMPAYQRTTVSKGKAIARTSAEAALDIVLSSMNTSFNASTGTCSSPYECATTNGSKQSTVQTYAGGSGLAVNTTVTVYNRDPKAVGGANGSTMHDALIAAQTGKYYRVVEAVATVGGYRKSVRAVMEPMFTATSGNSNGNTPNTAGVVFPYAAFGDQGMTIVGRTTVSSYTPGQAANALKDKLDANLGSNVNTGHVGQNTYPYMSIGGNQYEFPNPVSTQTAQMQNIGTQFNATLVSQAKWCQYSGNVYSNGSSTAHYPSGPADLGLPSSSTPAQATGDYTTNQANNNGWKNVRGLQNVDANTGAWTGGKVEAYMDYKKIQMTAAPTSPAGTQNLGSISLTSSAKVIFRPGATAQPTLTIGSRSSGTVVLPPGDYVTNSLSLRDTSSMIVEPGAKVNLYVEGSTSGNNILAVSKNATLNNGTNADARNLSVFTNSSKDIVVNGNSRSLIYAPNARVFVGAGANSNNGTDFAIPGFTGSAFQGQTNLDFWGSVIGRESYFLANPQDSGSQVRFHYDRSLIPTNYNFLARGTQPQESFQDDTAASGGRTFAGWRAVSYQEDGPPVGSN